MQDSKNKIEAILFTTGRYMDVEEIAKFCGIGSIGHVKEALKELIEDYEKREGPLTVLEEEGMYKLSIKKEFNYLTTNLLNDSELDGPTMKTLSLIAYKQPVMQSEIIDMRGVGAYDHIKTLREGQFINSERKGRSRLLKLSTKFYDYFDVVEGQEIPELKSEKVAAIEEDTQKMEQEVEQIERTLEEKQKEHLEKEETSEGEIIEVDNTNDSEETIVEESEEKTNE